MHRKYNSDKRVMLMIYCRIIFGSVNTLKCEFYLPYYACMICSVVFNHIQLNNNNNTIEMHVHLSGECCYFRSLISLIEQMNCLMIFGSVNNVFKTFNVLNFTCFTYIITNENNT